MRAWSLRHQISWKPGRRCAYDGGIEGLSRYGKAAPVAMAYEPRFAIGFIGSSGAGGAKIFRRVFGEQAENVASSAEYHWFAGNFIKYAGPLMPNDLPVDAHELIALCAPRPVFISTGAPEVEGHWIDARGMFLAGVHAGPVYRLLGKKGLGTDIMPPVGTGPVEGDAATAPTMSGAARTDHWYVSTGIDVVDENAAAVVTLGHTITDGRGSGTNEQNRWPDELGRRLQADDRTSDVAVLNMGIGGNCVLRVCLGPAALERFERDVLNHPGVRWLIVLEGVNDLGPGFVSDRQLNPHCDCLNSCDYS